MEIAGSSGIVTGGASGLGRAVAEALASRGVHVVVIDRDADLGEEVARKIDGTFAQADVASAADVEAAVNAATEVAPLRILVNCAGIPSLGRTIGRDGEFASAHDLDLFRRVVEVNLIGTFNCIRLAATAMSRFEPLASGERGAIVNTSSVAAFEGQIGQVAYSASKGGIVGMTLPLARDLAAAMIRNNTIAPGLVETPIYGEGEKAESWKAELSKSALFPQRLGRPEEFASLTLELLTNSYMNGEVVRMDAGMRLQPK